MERFVTDAEAREHFADILREVVGGESVTVTSAGRPVARMVPVPPQPNPEGIKRMLDYFRSQPLRYAGPWTREDLYD